VDCGPKQRSGVASQDTDVGNKLFFLNDKLIMHLSLFPERHKDATRLSHHTAVAIATSSEASQRCAESHDFGLPSVAWRSYYTIGVSSRCNSDTSLSLKKAAKQ